MNFAKFVEIAKTLKLTQQTGRAFHCSFAVKQKKIVCIGVNNYNKTNRVSASFTPTKISNNPNFMAGIHSEIAALGLLRKQSDLSKFCLVNVRINNNGHLDNSCPCPSCAWHVARAGFKRIFFSTQNGFDIFPN